MRVRLRFQSTPLHYAQKCWFTFDKEQCRLVGDVTYLISSQFGFSTHRNGLQLFMDDFLVPSNEKADVFRDNDLIEVKCVCDSNGVAESSSSSSSSDSSIPETQPPPPKRAKNTKKQSPPKVAATKKMAPVVPTKKLTSKKKPKKPVKSKPLNIIKQLHVSEKKTASGGMHLTFNSTDSSSESGEDERPTCSNETSKPVSPVKPVKPSVKPVDPSPSTRGGGKRGRGKGRGGRQRRSLPSNLVIGGPDDIHTTRSTVFTNTGGEQASTITGGEQASTNTGGEQASTNTGGEQASTITGGEQASAITGGEQASPNKDALAENDTSTHQTSTGWDVQPTNEKPPVINKDYSNYPNLDGAPRVGDQLAFKLLELSGSCTPEVSQYKLASVLSYNPTAKSVIVQYQGSSNAATAADNASSELAQFALEQEAMVEQECPEVVLELTSLITPKLVTT